MLPCYIDVCACEAWSVACANNPAICPQPIVGTWSDRATNSKLIWFQNSDSSIWGKLPIFNNLFVAIFIANT